MSRIFPFHHGMPRHFLSFMILVLGPLLLGIPCPWAASPITPSGLHTQVSDPIAVGGQTQYDITGGTRPQGGANLFHSFGEFGVPPNSIANFLNETALPTSNILARVTGNIRSDIFGTIQTTGFEHANLFLMNPHGFLFGPNATVNIGGMATFTTSDYIRLTDGGRFNANPDNTPADILSNAPVAAFGFLGSNPVAIINFEGSQLTVANGAGITLVGGDLNMVPDLSGGPSGITASGGQIRLTSVAGAGEVASDTAIPAPGTPLGNISLGQGTTLSTAGVSSFGDGSGGSISIRGGQFVATGASMLTSPASGSAGSGGAVTVSMTGSASLTGSSSIVTSSTQAGSAGAVSLTGNDSLTLTNSTINSSTSSAMGNSGPVILTTHGAGPLSVTNSTIRTSSTRSGNAGPVSMTGDLALSNVQIFTQSISGGNAGPVTLTGSPDVAISNGSVVNSFARQGGNGGAFTATGMNVTLDSTTVVADVNGLSSGMGTSHSGAVTLGGSDTLTVTLSDSSISTNSFQTVADGSPVKITGQTVNLINGSITASWENDVVPTINNNADIEIRGSNVNLSGFMLTNIITDNGIGSSGTGGSIRFLDAEKIELAASLLNASTSTSGRGGAIEFHAHTLSMTDGTIVASEAFGSGPGGNITVQGEQVQITNGSLLDARSTGLGAAGTVTIEGRMGPAQSVVVSGAGSGISTEALLESMAGGNISIQSHQVQFTDAAIISTSQTTGPGSAGSILVKADSVSITGGAQLTSSSVIGETGEIPTGNAGNITIQGLASPAQSILIDGTGSGIFTETQGTGAGGIIFVNASSATLDNGAAISAKTTGAGDAGSITTTGGTLSLASNSQISSASTGTTAVINPDGTTKAPGTAGAITITDAGSFASNASTVTTSAEANHGGDISITAQSVQLSGGTSISASSNAPLQVTEVVLIDGQLVSQVVGNGNAGNILINVGHNYTSTSSAVTTQAMHASGGNITVLATDMVQLTNSQLNTSVLGSSTTVGGNITIDPQYVLLQNSQILAQATQGQGGAISINITNGGLFLPDANSTISASSQSGVNGTVTIQNPNAPAGGHIQPLGQSPLLATSLLNQRCAALAGGEFSSFTVAGRDSLPIEPGSWLTSPLGFGTAGFSAGAVAEAGAQVRVIDPAHETTVLSLRQIAPAGFLTQTFAVDSPVGCQS